MLRAIALTSTILCLGLAQPALAQFQGPGAAVNQTRVADILRDPVDDQKVTLVGVVIRKVADERYLFSDGSGQIQVEIDDDDLPRDPFTPSTRLELRGEVDVERGRVVEIDVDRVRVL